MYIYICSNIEHIHMRPNDTSVQYLKTVLRVYVHILSHTRLMEFSAICTRWINLNIYILFTTRIHTYIHAYTATHVAIHTGKSV